MPLLERAGASILIFGDPDAACSVAADRLVTAIHSAVESRGRAILALATGSTPKSVYARLVARHRSGALSFADTTTYNLDEYYPISPCDPQSYRAYMHEHLFRHVDLPANHAHVLDGSVPESAVAKHAAQFDRWIVDDGGLDLQLLGVGRNGHLAFNEPSDLSVEAASKLPTRLVNLHPVTLTDAARDFGDITRVIPRALTMGLGPILAARSILVLALGPRKAEIVAQALLGPVTAQVPASLLQTVPAKVTWILDEAAAKGLS